MEPEELANSKGKQRGPRKLHHKSISRGGTWQTEDSSKEITMKFLCCYGSPLIDGDEWEPNLAPIQEDRANQRIKQPKTGRDVPDTKMGATGIEAKERFASRSY
jgi:hypothetical protein